MLLRVFFCLIPLFLFSAPILEDLWIDEDCEGNEEYPALVDEVLNTSQKILRKYRGEEIDKELLDIIRDDIVDAYHDLGYPLVGVYFPGRQDLTDGTLKACVAFAYVGKVTGEGAKWFSNEKLAKEIRLKKGDEIVSPTLMSDLSWLNNNPFRSVSLIYEKGDSLGDTNIVVLTKDRFPLRVVSGYENTGNIVAGNSRYFAGITWGDVFCLGHQFTYQFISANNVGSWWGSVASYIAPLPWRHTLEVYASYVQARPDLSSSIVRDKGKGWQIGGSYTIMLPSTAHSRNNLSFGYEFKRTNNFLDFDADLVFRGFVDISQFIVSFESLYEHDRGVLGLSLNLYVSPGDMTSFNRKRNFERVRPGADDEYVYGTLIGESVLRLPYSFSWEISAKGQFSGAQLLPTEELSVGGYLSVRGYDENEIISDQGIVVRNELRTPAFPFFSSFIAKRKRYDQMQFLAFFDYGYANGIDPNILDKNTISIYSVGPGFRYRIYDNVNVRFDYGFQLDKVSNRPFTSGARSRAHAGVIVSF